MSCNIIFATGHTYDYPCSEDLDVIFLQDTKTIGNDNSNENQDKCMHVPLSFCLAEKLRNIR